MSNEQKKDYTERYNSFLQKYNLILLAETGSKVLGLQSKNSDRDYIGVCIESLEQLTGFSTFEHATYRTAQDRTGDINAPSQPGDIDCTVYGLRKFLKMALGGNPNLLNLLFTPEAFCTIRTSLGAELQQLSEKIVSKDAYNAFQGYITQQNKKFSNANIEVLSGERVARPADFLAVPEPTTLKDVKFAIHLLRLGMQGRELLKTGKLTLPMNTVALDLLLSVRNGQMSAKQVLRQSQLYGYELDDALYASPLQAHPDHGAVQKWMLDVYRSQWERKSETDVHDTSIPF